MALDGEIAKLRAAFPPRPLDGAAAFEEWGRTHTSGPEFDRGVHGKTWPDLEAMFLERHHDALVFFGPSSFVDYLPAYLVAVMRKDPALAAAPSFLWGVLTRSRDAERFDARIARLTEEQRIAVAGAMAAYEADVAGTPRQEDVTGALDSYWRSLLQQRKG